MTLTIATRAIVSMLALIVILPTVEVEFGAGLAETALPYTLTMIGFAVAIVLSDDWWSGLGAPWP
ncbi:hypothetical protein [Parasedimentitalea psychrophila]|uniref:Uncharacterized protein n=1 Tax=Parasedimentitalea psychrophila TaxID=2997337 RepID=A0A9Y2P7K1_9RHOB|nr:hypothetical protein [Parasedimentitalea psychrophila]WIY25905.1 hypothetical protein QPJ95_02925 [Parasedimentitalea psychrophila]